MWVQPSLGVLAFIWENEDDSIQCLHPFRTEENPKKRVLETGRAAARSWQLRQISEHLLSGVTLVGHLVFESYPTSRPSSWVSCYALLLSLWGVQACYTSNRSEALLFVFSDMKIAFGFIGVFLFFLLGECVVSLPEPKYLQHDYTSRRAWALSEIHIYWDVFLCSDKYIYR